MARENIGTPVQNALAAQTMNSAMAGSSDVATAVQQARDTQASVNQRVDSFLRARGYDEPVQLVGTSIDLPATMKKMEAAKLTKRAQEMGYGDWFQVPPGPEQQQAREEVAQEVADDLRHATTVGRGAIFVDPDPLRTNEFLALAPPSLAAAAATVLPRTTATFTPSSAQLRTESPIQPALRAVAAPATVAASAGQRALDTGFFDKIQRGWEAENRAEEADEEGQPEQAVELRADAETYRNDAFRSAVAAATGRSEEQVGDWRTWLFNQGDPEATRALVEKVRTDPMLVQATDQLADDLIRVHRLDGATATAVRTTLNGAGLLGDFFGPDPVTPTFAALGTATRAGLRMAAETGDLARGATLIRDGLTAGKDLGEIVRDADQVYRGLGEALQIRVAAAARVNPDVVSNVRRLQGAAAKAEERVVKAQADLVLARGTVEEKAAARATAQAQADAAKLQVELATAHQQFADEVLAQWDAFGKGNLQRAERLQQVAMETKRESWAAEKALQDMDARNAPTLSRLEKLNQDVLDSADAVKLATDEQKAAATAIQAAKDRAKAARTAKDKAALDAALLDRKAAEDALALAKERRKNAVVARTATAKAQQDALRAAAPALMEQQKAAQRLFDLRAKVAELEQEAGWRILSVADDGKTADAALESGAGVLREAKLMPDVPPPLGAKSLDEMLARGQLWGDALKEAQVAAKARTLEAQRAFREAQRALGGSERATRKAAEKALREISDLGEAQYKRELAAARASAWKKEAEGLANDIDRGLKALQRKPKVLSERATNILDGALVATAKDGTRTLDTAAFRAKMEKAYSPDAVGWWLRHAGDDRPLWEEALGLRQSDDLLIPTEEGTRETVRLSPSDALRLQQGEAGLREGITRTMPEAQALAQTEALLALRKDPALRASSFLDTSINGLGRYYAAKWEAWKKTLDPMVAKVGDVDEKLVLVSKMASRRANLARDELLMVGRLAQAQPGLRGFVQLERGGSREIIRDLTRYMDTTDAIPLMGRASVFNRGEFNETIWDRARRQLLNDPDVVQDASGAAKAEQAAASGDEVVSIPNRPMLGLSRAWVPSGVGINSRQSGQLWKAAVSELTKSTTFDAFQKAMERRTLGIIGSVEHVPDKAVSYLARNAAQAAVQADTADLMVRELGGLLRAEEAADVNRVLTYDWDRLDSPAAAWEGLARVGQPFTQAATRTSRDAVAAQQALLELGTTRGGEKIFAMASQVRALDDTLDKVVKETYAHYAAARTPQEALALSHMLDLQQFWKSSVTIGLVVPSPRYFINNIAGNLSQIWLTQGLGTSARVVGQSLFHNVPFVGTLMERALDAAATRVGGAPFLGSMVEAFWNPNVTRILGGQGGSFRAANGIVYDLETVGRWASEDGVFTSFMQEEYGKLFGRSRGQGPLTRLRYLQDDIFAWANEIEVRQRTALYVDLLRQGYTRSAARERTLRALYDWEGALGAAESAYMTTLIPFYRFIKLGFRQAWYEAVAKPLIRPTEATLEAMTGSSGLARMRNQAELLRLPELQDDGDYEKEADKFDALARYRNLAYLNRRVQWTERNDPNMVEMYRGGRGQFMPYSTISLPALTAIDMGNLVTLSLYALPTVALSASGSDVVAPDASQPFWDEATNLAGPLAAPLIGSVAQTMGADSQTTRQSTRLKPGEAAVAQMLGLPVGIGADYERTEGTVFTKTVVGSLPLLLQAPQWYDALYGENPEVRRAKEQGYVAIEQVAPYFSWAASQLTGFTRSYPFDPDQTLTQHQTKFGEELQKVAEKETGPLRERQAVKP